MIKVPESDLTYLQKFALCVKHRGLLETLEITFTKVLFPLYFFYRKHFCDNEFEFDNKKYSYFFHPYNVTWISERTVEISITLDYLYQCVAKGGRFLEVGNVLNHYKYDDTVWPIVDKYERGEHVINKDIVDFNDGTKYDLILSVSTMEHVGFDEEDKNPLKVGQAVRHVAQNLLSDNGRFIFTFPLGFNQNLDKKILEGNMEAVSDIKYLKRVSKLKWEQVDKSQLEGIKYNEPYAGGNGLAVVYVNPVR